jgi:hypothetical protein
MSLGQDRTQADACGYALFKICSGRSNKYIQECGTDVILCYHFNSKIEQGVWRRIGDQ